MAQCEYTERDFTPFKGNAFGLVYEGALTENADGKVNIHSIRYPYRDFTAVANVYTPAGHDPAGSYPAVVVAHPNGGVKEQVAGNYAQKLAENGYIALAFDAAYQGESGGEPRMTDWPENRVEDIHRATDILLQYPGVDAFRTVALGICGGGGYTFKAAQTDKRFAAVATLSLFNSGEVRREGFRGSQVTTIQERLEAAAKARQDEANGGTAALTPNMCDTATPDEADAMPYDLYREGYYYYGCDCAHPGSTLRNQRQRPASSTRRDARAGAASLTISAIELMLMFALCSCASPGDGGSTSQDDAVYVKNAQEESAPEGVEASMAFDVVTKIDDVANDAAFDGFGRLLFPVDEGYMQGATLGDIRLAWYSYIDPQETAAELNFLRDEMLAGQQVFFSIYTEEEMAADPAKRNTGLFFFRGNAGARTAICNAGGGFAYVAAVHDSFPHAFELAKKGLNAFALIYRPGAQTACEDLSRTVAYLFEHADELDIDMDGYSLWGGSAGARMAAWVGTFGTQAFGARVCPKPAAVIMEYTGLSEVTGAEPPTFSVVGAADGIADWRIMERRTERIRQQGTPAEIMVFDGLSHGFGLGTGTAAEGWIEDAVAFWETQLH